MFVTKPGRLKAREVDAMEKYEQRGFRRVEHVYWMSSEPAPCGHHNVAGVDAMISRFDPLGGGHLPVFKCGDGWRTMGSGPGGGIASAACNDHVVLPASYTGVLEVNVSTNIG